jgi:hypothetical protein
LVDHFTPHKFMDLDSLRLFSLAPIVDLMIDKLKKKTLEKRERKHLFHLSTIRLIIIGEKT